MKNARRPIMSSQIKMRSYELKTIAGTNTASCLAAAIVVADDKFVFTTNHPFVTGDRVQLTTSNTEPTGLSLLTDYWIVKLNDTSVGLASTLANAVAGTLVNITNAGVGTQTLLATDKLSGPARLNCSVQTQATGVYKITFLEPFASASDLTAIVSANTADMVARIKTYAATYIEVEIQAIDETAAILDGFFSVIVFGSDTTSRWE